MQVDQIGWGDTREEKEGSKSDKEDNWSESALREEVQKSITLCLQSDLKLSLDILFSKSSRGLGNAYLRQIFLMFMNQDLEESGSKMSVFLANLWKMLSGFFSYFSHMPFGDNWCFLRSFGHYIVIIKIRHSWIIKSPFLFLQIAYDNYIEILQAY